MGGDRLLKGFGGGIHKVGTPAAVNVQVNKTRKEVAPLGIEALGGSSPEIEGGDPAALQ